MAGKNYYVTNKEIFPKNTNAFQINMGEAKIELRCEIYSPIDEHSNKIAVFYMANSYSSTEPCSIDTYYLVNMGDLKITELGALIEMGWRIPLKGANGAPSGLFVSKMKSAIKEASSRASLKDLPTFLDYCFRLSEIKLREMNNVKVGFRTGSPNWAKNLIKDYFTGKSTTSIGNRIGQLISVSETTAAFAPGNEFIFAAAYLDEKNNNVEFLSSLEMIFGPRDERARNELLNQQTKYVEDHAITDNNTQEKKYNKFYTAATDLLKYRLIRHGISTAGEVGKAVAGEIV